MKPLDTIRSVARHFDVTTAQIFGPSRDEPIVTARHVAMYLVRQEHQLSYPALGRIFDRDHSTIQHAVKKAGISALAAEVLLVPWEDRRIAELKAAIMTAIIEGGPEPLRRVFDDAFHDEPCGWPFIPEGTACVLCVGHEGKHFDGFVKWSGGPDPDEYWPNASDTPYHVSREG